VALSGQLNPEVDGWIAALTPCRRTGIGRLQGSPSITKGRQAEHSRRPTDSDSRETDYLRTTGPSVAREQPYRLGEAWVIKFGLVPRGHIDANRTVGKWQPLGVGDFE
jgi:hypothetical protein